MEALFRNDGLMSINYQIPASNSGKVLLQRKWAKHSATSLDKESTRTRTTWLEQEHEKFHNEELIHTRKSDAHLSKASKHHDHCVKPQQALQGPTQTTPSKAPCAPTRCGLSSRQKRRALWRQSAPVRLKIESSAAKGERGLPWLSKAYQCYTANWSR